MNRQCASTAPPLAQDNAVRMREHWGGGGLRGTRWVRQHGPWLANHIKRLETASTPTHNAVTGAAAPLPPSSHTPWAPTPPTLHSLGHNADPKRDGDTALPRHNKAVSAQRGRRKGTVSVPPCVTYSPSVVFFYGALDSHPFILHRTMQCRSSPEGPPSRCLDPPISVSSSAAGCGGQDMKDPHGINVRSAPRPVVWYPCCRPPVAVTAITPACLLMRCLALTPRVCSALSGGPRQVDSTDHSGARLPAGHGREPSTCARPGLAAQRSKAEEAHPPPDVLKRPLPSIGSRDALEERRGGGSGAQNFVSQKRRESMSPFVNFIFPHGSGGGGTPCVTFRRLLFFYGALDSHPFCPSHVASRCFLSAVAAGAPAGVVSAFAEPRGWCAGAVLDVAGGHPPLLLWPSALPIHPAAWPSSTETPRRSTDHPRHFCGSAIRPHSDGLRCSGFFGRFLTGPAAPLSPAAAAALRFSPD